MTEELILNNSVTTDKYIIFQDFGFNFYMDLNHKHKDRDYVLVEKYPNGNTEKVPCYRNIKSWCIAISNYINKQ